MHRLLGLAVGVIVTFGLLSTLQADIDISNISKFRLDLMQGGEDPAANWYAVSGGSQILHETDKTTDEDQFVMSDPGDIEFAEVEVVGPCVKGATRKDLVDWLNAWATGQAKRQNATLELLNDNQRVVQTINFFDTIPLAYYPPSVRAGDDALLEESLTFSVRPQTGPFYVVADIEIPAAKTADEILTGRAFKFEIDGKELPLVACDPGGITVLAGSKVRFENWRIEKYYSQGDLHLKDLFQAFASGQRKTNPSDTGSLIYLDRRGTPARRVNFFGFTPLHYESVSIDSRNAGSAATEVMEFSVLRCEYQ